MNNRKPHILIVDNYDSFTYNLVQMVDELGICSYEVMKNDTVDTECGCRFDAFLFSPGPGVPHEAPVMQSLLKAYHASRSFLGICLGYQAIAEFFGATLENLNTVYHGQRRKIVISDPSDYLFNGIPEIFVAGLYHSWAVTSESLPDSLAVSAISSDGVIMALSHKEYDIRGVQFHPESYMTEYGSTLLKNWLGNIKTLTSERVNKIGS